MSKHTPGPWMTGAGRGNTDRVYATDGHQVAACGDAILRGEPEKQANARLIAAAPDLLAACIKMRATMYSPDSEHSIMADAAIAKATGE